MPVISADIVLLQSYYGKIGIELFKKLKTQDNLVSIDVQAFLKDKNADNTTFFKPWADMSDYLKYVDILKLTANELYNLTGRATISSASQLIEHGVKTVIVRAGKTTYVFWGKKYTRIPAYSSKIKNIAGAGEVYDAAFTIRMKETGNDVIEAAYFAEAAIALCKENGLTDKALNRKNIEKYCKTLKSIFIP